MRSTGFCTVLNERFLFAAGCDTLSVAAALAALERSWLPSRGCSGARTKGEIGPANAVIGPCMRRREGPADAAENRARLLNITDPVAVAEAE